MPFVTGANWLGVKDMSDGISRRHNVVNRASTMYQTVRMGRTVVLVPAAIRRISGGLWTHSACRPGAVRVGNAVARLTGLSLRLLRIGTVPWEPPFDSATWADWLDTSSNTVGAEVRNAVLLPADQRHRRRFALVLLDTNDIPIGFVKWTRNPPNPLGLEAERLLSADPPRHFMIPRLLKHDTVDGWSYTINEMLPAGPHGPANLVTADRRLIAEEIHTRLAGIDESDDVVSQGDFAPWNVRRLASGTIAVIDWEDVRPSPAAADELWNVVTSTLAVKGSSSQAVRRVRSELSHYDDAALARAARFLQRRGEEQPPEVDHAMERSTKLLRFERSIGKVLRSIVA